MSALFDCPSGQGNGSADTVFFDVHHEVVSLCFVRFDPDTRLVKALPEHAERLFETGVARSRKIALHADEAVQEPGKTVQRRPLLPAVVLQYSTRRAIGTMMHTSRV